MSRKFVLARAAFGLSLFSTIALLPGAASAHHAMGFEMPATFFQGLLSGFGHPVIGFDHLAFILAIGLIATLFARGFLLPLIFVGATLAGCGIHLLSWDLPAVEPVVSFTVIVGGALLAYYKALDFRLFALLLGAAGVFHGYAYGESIVGAETTPLLAYLLGFAFIQTAISLSAMALAKSLLAKRPSFAGPAVRLAGVAIALAGAVFFSGAIGA